MTITLTEDEAKLVVRLTEIALESQGMIPVIELNKRLHSELQAAVKPVPAVQKKRGK